MAEPTVVRGGTDSSGRPVLMTRYQRRWWRRVCRRLGFTPVITQGAWMAKAGGGAAASAGYHDGGGCLDLRVWDRTDAEVRRMIHVLRLMGAAAWLRNQTHGGFSDPHIHLVLGSDRGLAVGARRQWAAYVSGNDGMASNAPDYHWRPDPLVLTPPPSTAKARAAVQDAIDEAARIGLPVADKLRTIKDRIRRW
jgi:hypothetical protein